MINTLPLFAMLALVTVATPGPTTLLTLHHSARWGLRASLGGIGGAVASDAVLITAVAVGLGALLSASATAFELLRWLGVGYLAWLGWQWLRAPRAHEPGPPQASGRLVLRSFTAAITNPKGYLFFAAVLPPFIDPGAPTDPQHLMLAAVFMAIDASVLLVYAVAGARGLGRLQVATQQRIERISGGAMLCMAAALALWRRPGG